MSFFNKFFNREKEQDLEKGLEKTKEGLFGKISRAVAGKSEVDEDVLDELESILISSDVGLDTTVKIIDRIEARVAKDKYVNTDEQIHDFIFQNEVQLVSVHIFIFCHTGFYAVNNFDGGIQTHIRRNEDAFKFI